MCKTLDATLVNERVKSSTINTNRKYTYTPVCIFVEVAFKNKFQIKNSIH